MPSAALAAVQDSPSPPHCSSRLRSPLAKGRADFELGHFWRAPLKRAPSCAPTEIEIPNDYDDNEGYVSLSKILSSPQYAANSPSAAAGGGGGGGSCGDIHMIRHPLVKHAAYAYLQMTPSAREDPGRRPRRWRGPLCRLLFDCLSFIGALFRP